MSGGVCGLRATARKLVSLSPAANTVPLEGVNGTVLADFVVDSGTPVVLSLRHLSLGDQRRFATDFAERLYRRKGEAGNRGPLHLFVDECDEFIPQNIQKGGERMFGSFDRLVRRGRSSGIGMTLISQRPQVVNKSVLSQCETLICHRLLHKLDRKAVDEWISAHDTEGHRAVFMESLASLPRGRAWLWSPSWLDIFERVEMRRRDTYDSSATPTAGTQPLSPKKLAPIDMDALRGRLKETVEEAEADDPKKLKAEIARLKADAGTGMDQARLRDLQDENRALRGRHSQFLAHLRAVGAELQVLQKRQRELIDSLAQGPPDQEKGANSGTSSSPPETPPRRAELPVTQPKIPPAQTEIAEIGTGMQKVLEALSKLEACGISPADRVQVAFFAGYSNAKSGGFAGPVGQLGDQGYLVSGNGQLRLTDKGRAATSHVVAPATTRELHAQLFSILGSAEAKLLRLLIGCYPEPVSRQELASQAGYGNAKSGGFAGPLGRLTSLGLAETTRPGYVAGTSLLFLKGALNTPHEARTFGKQPPNSETRWRFHAA